MDRPAFHFRHPRRAGRAVCGATLLLDIPKPTVAVLAAPCSVEVQGSVGLRPACKECLLALFRTAMDQQGIILVVGPSEGVLAVESQHLWTGRAVRQRREDAGLSRANVARIAGLSETTIRNFESERHKVSTRVVYRLMAVPQLAPKPPVY